MWSCAHYITPTNVCNAGDDDDDYVDDGDDVDDDDVDDDDVDGEHW